MSDKSDGPANKGLRLEYLAAQLLERQGYLVRTRVPVTYGESSQQDATDLDVYALGFSQPFQRHTVLCDCKDRQRGRPLERVFWAKGVAASLSIDETYVCLPQASVDLIEFAGTHGVRVLTRSMLDQALTATRASFPSGYGLTDPQFAELFYGDVRAASKTQPLLGQTLAQVREQYRLPDPYVGLNRAFLMARTCLKAMRADQSATALWRYVLADVVVLMSVLLLMIANDTVQYDSVARKERIIKRLSYGDVAPRKAEEIFRLASQLVVESIRAIDAKMLSQGLLPFNIGSIEPPPYAADVVGIVNRAMASPGTYCSVSTALDYLLFGQALRTGEYSESDFVAFAGEHVAEDLLKVAKNVVVFARDHVGFEPRLFWREGLQTNHKT